MLPFDHTISVSSRSVGSSSHTHEGRAEEGGQGDQLMFRSHFSSATDHETVERELVLPRTARFPISTSHHSNG